jgi:hypothetical protein
MSLPSSPYSPACAIARSDVLACQRVFLAHVDVALGGADGISPEDQAFENAVRIAFEQAAIHVRARISLVAVHDHILGIARGPSELSPTSRRRKIRRRHDRANPPS